MTMMCLTRKKRLALVCVTAMMLSVLLPVGDAFAQRAQQRGSVRSTNRSSSSGTRQRATTQRTTSGNTSSRTTTGQTRSGETVSGSRNVTKDGDTINVDRNVQSSSGASVSKSKEIEVDDGRVESVERDVSATDRYGRTAQYEGKAERDGAGWEFEGEGKNRAGQDVEVDGYGARGYYGSGVVADVEGGRYGNRTVVAGKPYGGPARVQQLPYGARPYSYWGRPYYAHGGVYYRPYTVHGVAYYGYIPPPYYVVLPATAGRRHRRDHRRRIAAVPRGHVLQEDHVGRLDAVSGRAGAGRGVDSRDVASARSRDDHTEWPEVFPVRQHVLPERHDQWHDQLRRRDETGWRRRGQSTSARLRRPDGWQPHLLHDAAALLRDVSRSLRRRALRRRRSAASSTGKGASASSCWRSRACNGGEGVCRAREGRSHSGSRHGHSCSDDNDAKFGNGEGRSTIHRASCERSAGERPARRR